MAKVRVEGLCSRCWPAQPPRGRRTRRGSCPTRKPTAYVGEQGLQDSRVVDDTQLPRRRPWPRNQDDHHRAEQGDPTRAEPIRCDGEKQHDDHRRDRHEPTVPSDGWTILSPSTADSTEIAGVIMLSPKNKDAPKIPSAASASLVPPATRPRALRLDQGNERQDAALAVVVGAQDQQRHIQSDQRVTDQKISESTPKTVTGGTERVAGRRGRARSGRRRSGWCRCRRKPPRARRPRQRTGLGGRCATSGAVTQWRTSVERRAPR